MNMSEAIITQPAPVGPKGILLADFRELITQGCFSHDMVELNSIGRENFLLSGYPIHKDERFTYLDLTDVKTAKLHLSKEPSHINREGVEKLLFPSTLKSRIVFLDGVYMPHLSEISAIRTQIEISPLGEAFHDRPEVKKEILDGAFAESDPFANLNAAFAINGAYLRIKDGEHLKAPLEILYLAAENKAPTPLAAPRLVLDVGEKAKVDFIFKNTQEQAPYFFNAVADITARAEAKVNIYHLALSEGSGWRFMKMNVHQCASSSVKLVSINSGSRISRTSYDWKLKEPGATMEIKSLAPLDGIAQNHVYARVSHEAPDCSSQLLFKNIVDGKSRSSVDSTVTVAPGAKGSFSHQMINNLLISEGSRADNKPNLSIHNDDVQCSHGATIGQLDDEALFYLMSRGLGRSEAARSLMNGFAKEVISAIAEPYALAVVEENILKHYGG
jgi:Fe-S cluster assembly protein SufD